MVVWSSFQYPESSIKFEEPTRVYLDKRDYGVGTLFVSERLGLFLFCKNENSKVFVSLEH